ncbi:MAG: hypothetical protein LBC64_04015 [Fibromonadaceae bacterium]|jgi:uncharacterized Zn finger protein (UPF0148 family)|nr:hypothetical protein [Fibromonadaceae bacterium]
MPNIEIICPCCDNILVIDTFAKEVVSHRERKKKESLEAFLEHEKNKSTELEKKLAEAREKEKNRSEFLKKKFEEAKNNKDLKDPAPNIIWD